MYSTYRTHTCGELRRADVGQTVTLAGWVHRRRDHGGVVFVDLRDQDGLTQIVFNPSASPQAYELSQTLRVEYVIRVTGVVNARPAAAINPRLATGEVEVLATSLEVVSPAQTPPFPINEETEVDETLRLRYRYLDLRRPRMRDIILLRHRIVKFVRDYLDSQGFIEVETPILSKSTPEGARDFLVPSRLFPGKFYALPQSPQQYKQLLMVAGFHKYFQIAKCFRDEDMRADRQPEFTQIDLEMNFVDQEDVLQLVEGLFTSLVRTIAPQFEVVSPFPRLTYADAMARFGTDKPDLRFGLELVDLTDLVGGSAFAVFRDAVAAGGAVKALVAPGCAGYSRREQEELEALAKGWGARGLVRLPVLAGPAGEGAVAVTVDGVELAVRSPVARYLAGAELSAILARAGARPGDLVLIVADRPTLAAEVLGKLRNELGARLGLRDPKRLVFAFVTDFPLFTWDETEQRWDPAHHPFTMYHPEDAHLLDTDPGKVRSKAYDLICNGWELASGSVRVTNSAIQRDVFRRLGYSDEQIEERFGHLVRAYEYGGPPHAGIAPGVDRIVMLLAGTDNIRDVIAFPKTGTGYDPLMDSPSAVAPAQLRTLSIAIAEPTASR